MSDFLLGFVAPLVCLGLGYLLGYRWQKDKILRDKQYWMNVSLKCEEDSKTRASNLRDLAIAHQELKEQVYTILSKPDQQLVDEHDQRQELDEEDDVEEEELEEEDEESEIEWVPSKKHSRVFRDPGWDMGWYFLDDYDCMDGPWSTEEKAMSECEKYYKDIEE